MPGNFFSMHHNSGPRPIMPTEALNSLPCQVTVQHRLKTAIGTKTSTSSSTKDFRRAMGEGIGWMEGFSRLRAMTTLQMRKGVFCLFSDLS